MKIFRKIIISLVVLLIILSLYIGSLHYRREPFIYSTAALEYFIKEEKRLPNDVNEILTLYNKEFTPMTESDVKLINWQLDWDKLIKKDGKLFDENGKRVYIISPRAIDPFMRREAKRNSIYLYDIYQKVKQANNQ